MIKFKKHYPSNRTHFLQSGIMNTTILLLILSLTLTHSILWNKRNLQCFLKAGTSITSHTIRSWRYTTQGSIGGVSCAKAHERVRSRCNLNLNTKQERQMICDHYTAQLPTWPNKKVVSVTKMGKADCMDHVAHNFWRDEDSHGVSRVTNVCCTKYKPYPWAPMKVHCCDSICY